MGSSNLTLPRTKPRVGTVAALIIIKTARGSKIELAGTFDEDKMLAIWDQINACEVAPSSLPADGEQR